MVPPDVRPSCVGIDLTDADPEIVCTPGEAEIYLARWGSIKAAQDALTEELASMDCDLLDRVDGVMSAGKTTIGVGGGCATESTFEFEIDRGRLQGDVYVDGGTLEDAQAWMRGQRPGVSVDGALGGGAFGARIGDLDVKHLKRFAKAVAYRTLLRNPDSYGQRLLYFRGRVLQVLDDGALVQVTRVFFVSYTALERLLARDLVEFVGVGAGSYDYVTVAGTDAKVPAIEAIDLLRR